MNSDAAELAQTLFEEIGDAAFIVEPETMRLLDVNPMALRLTGLSRERLLALPPSQLFRSDEDVDLAHLARALQTTRTFHSQEGYRLRRGDDEGHTPVNLTLTRLHTETRTLGLVLARDVSERHRAEAEVKQANADLERNVQERTADLARANESLTLFRRLIDRTTDAIEVIDPDSGRILDVNERACVAHGYSRAEYLALSAPDLDPALAADPAAWPRAVEAVRRSGSLIHEGRHRRKDGSLFHVEVQLTYIPLERAYLVAVVRDITERRRMEEQLQQARKMEAIGRLAGGIAHDFNNLLTVITGYSDLLLTDMPAADPRREWIVPIREAGERAARLTGQLLAFSRKAIVEPKVIDLNEWTDRISTVLRQLVGDAVALSIVLGPGSSRVRIDPGQIERAVLVLATNAREAMPRGGRLTIETAGVSVDDGDPDMAPGRYVRLSVSDTGVGMTEEVRARIFEPFFTTKDVGKGAALGLATVYGIVKANGGHVRVESRLGAGTTFTLWLPSVAVTAPSDQGGPRVAGGGTETVLVAEDEPAVRRLARSTLERQGYVVLEAGCGTDAVRIARAYTGPIHLLLTDVVMPDFGGHDLANAIRAERPEIKVLYMSGYTDDDVLRLGVSEKGDAFLPKPFTPGGLGRKVRAVLDGPV